VADLEVVPQPTPRKTLFLLAVAAVVGSFLALIAPSDWKSGPAEAVLSFEGDLVLDLPVMVGTTDEFAVEGSGPGGAATVTFPDGIPTEGVIEADIRMTRDGESFRPDVEDVVFSIRLSDGSEELVPVIGWNEEGQFLEALRRPPQDAAVVLGLLGFVVVLWVSEALPLFVTSLIIPVVLVFGGIARAAEATSPFFNPIIVLFFAGFLMAEAMSRSRLDHLLAVNITARSGRSPAVLYGSMLGLTALMSMFMSNTAAAAVLIPIAIAVSEPLAHIGFRKALVLGIAFAATIGGVGSSIGTPANQLAIEFLDEFGGRSISFVEWFPFGLPLVLLFLPVMGIYLWKASQVNVDRNRFLESERLAREESEKLGPPTRDQWVVLAVFIAVMAGWLTQTWHGIHPGIVALAGALLLFALRRLEPEDLSRISWPALLTFGGGLTLGLFIVRTGTSDYVATRLAGLADIPSLAALLVVAAITLLLTTVASNTASAAILIPLAIPLAGVLGISTTTLVMVVAIASSVDFALVIGTPPTMIAYSTRLYTAGQIFRKGIVLDVAGILLLVLVVVRIWEALGLT
jgi:sodium-dependent dicarboxylate transporter 2/3/5